MQMNDPYKLLGKKIWYDIIIIINYQFGRKLHENNLKFLIACSNTPGRLNQVFYDRAWVSGHKINSPLTFNKELNS